MKYDQKSELWYGSASLTIGDLFERTPELFAGFDALVTCLDSGTAVGRMLEADPYRLGLTYEIYGEHSLVRAESVKAFLQSKFVVHFDEIWLLRSEHSDVKMFSREAPRFTSDYLKFADSEPPRDFVHFFRDIGAVLALGDGVDLNFATSSLTIFGVVAELQRAIP